MCEQFVPPSVSTRILRPPYHQGIYTTTAHLSLSFLQPRDETTLRRDTNKTIHCCRRRFWGRNHPQEYISSKKQKLSCCDRNFPRSFPRNSDVIYRSRLHVQAAAANGCFYLKLAQMLWNRSGWLERRSFARSCSLGVASR